MKNIFVFGVLSLSLMGPTGVAMAASEVVSNAGSWSSTKIYSKDSIVQYQGSSWIALKANKNRKPGGTSVYWDVLAAKGAKGDTGATGPKGAKGDTGAAGIGFDFLKGTTERIKICDGLKQTGYVTDTAGATYCIAQCKTGEVGIHAVVQQFNYREEAYQTYIVSLSPPNKNPTAPNPYPKNYYVAAAPIAATNAYPTAYSHIKIRIYCAPAGYSLID